MMGFPQNIYGIATALLLAFMLPGVVNRTRAVLSGRKGIRFFQHMSNVRLLLRKGAVYSPVTSFVFRTAPCVCLAAPATALLFVPVGEMPPLLAFDGDVVVFAYLLALGRLMLILAAMDTGSSFEGMGASREALYGALMEPALLVVAGTLALVSGHTSFGSIMSDPATAGETPVVTALLFYVMLNIIVVEAGRIPVDDPRTHLELTMIHEVMVLDYSGVDLAFITIGGWLKTAALAILAADALSVVIRFDWITVCAVTLGEGVVIGWIESFRARNRLTRNSTYILTIVALASVVFFVAYLMLQNLEL